MKVNKALIVFAKKPTPGRVKTRMTPRLSPEQAADLYECMLIDVLAKAGQITGTDMLVFYEQGADARQFFERVVGGRIFPQEGMDLGEKMAEAFRHAFTLGYGSVAIIGTDSPDLPKAFIEKAYEVLEDAGVDAVFGPSEDGGYYLLAMKRLWPELFRGIPWSTGEVLERSLAQAESAGIRAELLPVWYDVDRFEDLLRPGLVDLDNGAPFTREFVETQVKVKVKK